MSTQLIIDEKQQGDTVILFLKGNMMGGPESMEVHEKVKKIIEDGTEKLVIDLGKVAEINSSGLGTLMASLTSLKNNNGQLKISRTTEKITNLFMITKLLSIFDTYDTIDEAVSSFKN